MSRHDRSVAADTAGIIWALRRLYDAGKLADELKNREDWRLRQTEILGHK
jgi:hypothetical protein